MARDADGGEPADLDPVPAFDAFSLNGGDGDGGDGDGGGDDIRDGGDEADTVEDLIARVDSDLSTVEPDEDEPDVEAGDGKTRGRTSRTVSALDAFIQQNYGGDVNAFLNSQFESRSAATKLAEEKADLQRQLDEARNPKTPVDREAQAKELLTADPVAQSYNRQLSNYDAEAKALVGNQRALVNVIDPLKADLAGLEARLLKATEEERTEIRFDIVQKQLKLSRLEDRFDGNERTWLALKDKVTTVRGSLEDRRAHLLSSHDDEQRRSKQDSTNSTRANTHFERAFRNTAVKTLQFDPKVDKERMDGLLEFVRGKVAAELDRNRAAGNEDYNEYELAEITARTTVAAAKQLGIRGRSGNPANGRGPSSSRRPNRAPASTGRTREAGGGGGRVSDANIPGLPKDRSTWTTEHWNIRNDYIEKLANSARRGRR